MSWLSIPLPNPFKSLHFPEEQEEDDEEEEEEKPQNDGVSSGGGVIGESFGRQLRAFISAETSDSGDGGSHSSRTFEGIRSDLEEFKGTFKNSLSILSSNRAVSEISKLASNFLQFNDENDVDYVNTTRNNKNDDPHDDDDDDGNDDDDDDVGINDEVIEFAHQISNRPELWIEFPLSLDYEFDMSEAHYEHASIIEQLVPSLGDVKSRISSDKSDKQFWMIYFILLIPRLTEEDLELLSTPEIVEARETLLKMLQAKKSEEINFVNPQSDNSSDSENEVQGNSINNSQSAERTLENLNASRSIESNDSNNTKKILEAEDGSSVASNDLDQPAAKHENSYVGLVTEVQEEKPVTAATSKQFQSEDDVSFSDLEDDDTDVPYRQSSSGPLQLTRTSSPEASNDWVQLNKNVEAGSSQVKGQSSLRDRDSEGEDSTGWLTVDDFDP